MSATLAGLAVVACTDGSSPETSTPDSGGAGAGPPWFAEVAARAGVDFAHVSGAAGDYLFPEIMGGGVALFDADNDGRLDLYLVQSGSLTSDGGPANALYANRGELRFEDVTAAAGVGDRGYGMGCAAGDFDGDGHTDLFVTNLGPNVLYRNRGDGTFDDVSTSATAGDRWSTSTGFLDHDNDGDLDLFVVNYIVWSLGQEKQCLSSAGARVYCSPNSYESPVPDVLCRNDGAGGFADVSAAAGLHAVFGNGLGVAIGDYDDDGWTDLYVANDGNPNQLWMNRGDGTFADESLDRACAVNAAGQSEAGMGVQALDYDHDGDLDLFLTHLRHETNTFYRNAGRWFDERTAPLGLAAPSYAFTGFGLGFADFDHDARLDLYIANGRVVYWDPPLDADDVYAEPNQLFRGRERGFEQVEPPGGTSPVIVATSRAAAFGDLDDDGDVDVVVVNRDRPVSLLENVAPKQGDWIAFRVNDENGRPALGATVRVETADGTLTRRVQTTYSYCASNDPRVHFGLGAGNADVRVEVRWRDGTVEDFGRRAPNAAHALVRGAGER